MLHKIDSIAKKTSHSTKSESLKSYLEHHLVLTAWQRQASSVGVRQNVTPCAELNMQNSFCLLYRSRLGHHAGHV